MALTRKLLKGKGLTDEQVDGLKAAGGTGRQEAQGQQK